MNNRQTTALFGLSGVLLFATTAIIGGFQFEQYDVLAQLISETAALDAPWGGYLRWGGYMPAGICLTLFSISAPRYLPKYPSVRIGFGLLTVFYGLATILASLFPCDAGCNKEFIDPSISHIIHMTAGVLTYLFVPLGLAFIGFGLWRSDPGLARMAIIFGIVAYLLLGVVFLNPESQLIGLWQRIIEGSFLLFTAAASVSVLRSRGDSVNL